MKLSKLYSKNFKDCNQKPVISIEIFPPKASDKTDLDTKEELYKELQTLNKTKKPALVSITYGAAGTNSEKSDEIIQNILEKFNYSAIMPHFTCVCSKKEFIEKHLNTLKTYGVENILALKGDEPEDIKFCHRDFRYASDLVEFIKAKTDFEIAVAGYPEGHIASDSLDEDIKHLKTKVSKGGSVIFTQFFFENDKFYRYLELLDKNEINVPVAAGLLPVVSYQGLIKMIKLSGIKPSKKVLDLFEKYKESKEDIIKAGIEQASTQAKDLIQNGVSGLHFYTLNKARSTAEILKNICIY